MIVCRSSESAYICCVLPATAKLLIYVSCSLWWHTIAILVSSVATSLYILARACSTLLDKWVPTLPYIGYAQQMSHTWHALHLRCHQLLAWPFILLWGGTRYFLTSLSPPLVAGLCHKQTCQLICERSSLNV